MRRNCCIAYWSLVVFRKWFLKHSKKDPGSEDQGYNICTSDRNLL
jgi:hypothetical protein